jgi:S-adenosylmethionine:tRNA ribosyltransferase-isomerase
LHYELPAELIADRPAEPRGGSRLLVLHRASGALEHRQFGDLGEYVRAGDCLVLNNTRVIPARFFARRASGGRVEGLFLRVDGDAAPGKESAQPVRSGNTWRALLRSGARLQVGERLSALNATGGDAPGALEFELLERVERGEWRVRTNREVDALAWLRACGETPLPPYILRARGAGAREADVTGYQTVYAAAEGAVAAPTAGLHFTAAHLERLSQAGIAQAFVTLHVGVGTFQPIEADDLAAHRMHAEWYEAPAEALATFTETRRRGGRIVAVGTTAARVLETLPPRFGGDTAACAEGLSGWTKIFLYPPYRFRNVDALLTNFHLPESTLLALVMAFASPEQVRGAYAAAIAARYRFYSYGDAMLIL